jgi:predicted dinucleotide-binding enzyme
MGLIRVVLAVALATALLGASLPVAERVERDRNAALATDELQELARAADRLAADNDPVALSATPAERVLVVRPPAPTITDGGRIVVDDDRLTWAPATGDNHSVEAAAELQVSEPIVLAEPTRLRLSFVRSDGPPVVRVERAKG